MDFNKTSQGRINSFAGDQKTHFGSRRHRRNSNSDDNSNYGGSNNGRYVPPSKRNANKYNSMCGISDGIFLPDAEDRRKAPPPDTGNQERFPSLTSTANIVSEPDKETSNPSFAAIATDKEVSPKVPVEKEPLKPGWVRRFRGPNGEIMCEHGPPVPENPYIKRIKYYEEYLARQHLIDTLERNIAYTREMDLYYDVYDDYDDYNREQDYYEDEDEDDYDYEDDEDYLSVHEYEIEGEDY